jgi:hypothetical protein
VDQRLRETESKRHHEDKCCKVLQSITASE